jgi:hypothetical protein
VDGAEVVDPERRQVVEVAPQVARIGAQRVDRTPPLDREMVQERLDGLLRRGQG